jgi:hypothetical protein
MVETLQKYKPGIYKMGRCSVTVEIKDGLWHLFITGNGFKPSHDEVASARYKFIPDEVTMCELYPPKEYLDKYPFSHRLIEIYLKF